jgi:hypothetical protein
MIHHTNLVVQVLSKLNMVNKLESLFQTLYAYFYKSPKRHLELIKLTKIMEIKRNRPPNNVKTRWISMLALAKKVMSDSFSSCQYDVIFAFQFYYYFTNFNLMCDIEIL